MAHHPNEFLIGITKEELFFEFFRTFYKQKTPGRPFKEDFEKDFEIFFNSLKSFENKATFFEALWKTFEKYPDNLWVKKRKREMDRKARVLKMNTEYMH